METLTMNGPVEFDMKVHLVNGETGQYAQVTIGMGVGEYPTPQKIQDRISKLEKEEIQDIAPGFRLATKREFWDAIMIEKTGQRFALVGGSEFDPV